MRTSALVLLLAACASTQSQSQPQPQTQRAARQGPADADSARAFARQTNEDLKRLGTDDNVAQWIKATYITGDTEQMAAERDEALLGYTAQAVKDAARWNGVQLDPETARMLYLLRTGSPLAAPRDPQRRLELTTLANRLEGIYGKGKWCKPDGTCLDIDQLDVLFGKSQDPDELREAWEGWHRISREMKPLYARFVELANEGAREIGFADTGAMWRSGYDMAPEQFQAELDRLWGQVKPLYDDLHCYVRARLQERYGHEVVPLGAAIPADLLGNMWAQDWSKIYPLVEPYPGHAQLDVTAAMQAQRWDYRRMMKLGESFFTSLGLTQLPQTFWERSLFTKPRDREVVCHASAWDIDGDEDVRIKMCAKVEEEDLVTIHHELGHDYYFLAYRKLPWIFRAGANDGFHEAIGDAVALSVTPGYLKSVGLVHGIPHDERGVVDVQMKEALDKVAFLPFGLLIDRWRWEVFAGRVKPQDYNKAWWDLRRKYQGVAPPLARSEEDFDPGAKYHVPANVPYSRYFIARILQFQFHRALCRAAGFTGPLHECSVHGSKAAGEKLWAMLSLGASRPWQDALEAMTSERQMDAAAMLEYFAPLRKWLAEQNRNRKCGW
jgi:peptidyl-dipeptidase A